MKGWDDESRVMGKAVICCEPGRQYEEIYLTLGVKALWLYHYKGPAEPDAGSVIWPRTIHSWLPSDIRTDKKTDQFYDVSFIVHAGVCNLLCCDHHF